MDIRQSTKQDLFEILNLYKIAREFMKEAPIVLMDEPSSALDTYSENAVLEAMSVFMKKKTVIMVSHRMTGAEKFNRVVRMD